jgi:hypothetical protein
MIFSMPSRSEPMASSNVKDFKRKKEEEQARQSGQLPPEQDVER